MNEVDGELMRRLNRQVTSSNWCDCDDLESLLEGYRTWREHCDSIAALSMQATPGTGMKLLKEGISDGLDSGS